MNTTNTTPPTDLRSAKAWTSTKLNPRKGTDPVAEANRHRALVSLDGLAMTELANIAAIYVLQCNTKASHSAILRRAVDLLHEHIAPLMDEAKSSLPVLAEQAEIRAARVPREGLAGWSLDSRSERIEQGRNPVEIDMDGDDQEDEGEEA